MKKTIFMNEGNFYKGNIHCHSTRSDGKRTTDEVVQAYKDNGYNFLAFTEHSRYSNFSQYNTSDFITIQSVEANPIKQEGECREYHFIALPGSDEHLKNATKPMYNHDDRLPNPMFYDYTDLQLLIDDLYDRGYMVMINHPFWSRIEYDEILPLKNLFAVEIFNFCSEIVENMGESNVCYDALLRNDKKLWCTAVDDNHNDFPLDSSRCDSFGGFIMVKSKSLDERSICNAIAQGSFYSSMGPEIYDFFIEDDEVIFNCSPVEKIYLNGDVRQIKSMIAEDKQTLLTSFRAKLSGDERYIRIECYDLSGKKAYTNPIWI